MEEIQLDAPRHLKNSLSGETGEKCEQTSVLLNQTWAGQHTGGAPAIDTRTERTSRGPDTEEMVGTGERERERGASGERERGER